jgi:hypothetical protein
MSRSDFLIIIIATKSTVGSGTDLPKLPSVLTLCDQPLIIHQVAACAQARFYGFLN